MANENDSNIENLNGEKTQIDEKIIGEVKESGTESNALLTKQIDDLKGQVEKYKNDYLYLRAEFDNYKKHAIKERADLIKYGSERLLNEVLGVIDNFDRALELKVTADNLDTYVKGVKMSAHELKSMLGRFGVTEVNSEGQVFDPMWHEALGAEESDSVKEGHVLRVFKKAYKLHDKMIRPAQVIVAKKKS